MNEEQTSPENNDLSIDTSSTDPLAEEQPAGAPTKPVRSLADKSVEFGMWCGMSTVALYTALVISWQVFFMFAVWPIVPFVLWPISAMVLVVPLYAMAGALVAAAAEILFSLLSCTFRSVFVGALASLFVGAGFGWLLLHDGVTNLAKQILPEFVAADRSRWMQTVVLPVTACVLVTISCTWLRYVVGVVVQGEKPVSPSWHRRNFGA